MVEEYLRKAVGSYHRDWDARPPIVLIVCRASTGLTPANVELGREFRLPCYLMFETPLDSKRPTINQAPDLVDHVHDIQNYASHHLKLTSDRKNDEVYRIHRNTSTKMMVVHLDRLTSYQGTARVKRP
ncbi:hypothetical protein B7P43_G12385 [Cryptotermes secundus]|uniref:Uncharacterized protein n=1 Tax=Cryptotermes secundus TaxID=105785 RepID=A0A2J7RBL9_9NEOP|nr:hypothetical protein B7P43_G12385 [Cryptotermes secundus]